MGDATRLPANCCDRLLNVLIKSGKSKQQNVVASRQELCLDFVIKQSAEKQAVFWEYFATD